MSQPIKGTAVRLPLDLHTLISDAAVENNRSRHAEMLHRLDSSFSEPAMMETDEALAVLNKVAENVMTEVLTRLFTGLEDRLAALIAKKMEAAEMSLITEVRIDGNAEDLAAAVRGYDFTTGKRRVSPTGRLSDPQPELQDLPAVSGMSTLAASVGRLGVCPECSSVTKLDLYHTGGYVTDAALKDGEVPAILSPGQQRYSHADWEQIEQRIGRWTENTGVEPERLTGESVIDFRFNDGSESLGHVYANTKRETIWAIEGRPRKHVTHWRHSREVPAASSTVTVTVTNIEGNQDAQPFTSQAWVITGSLETMTRDRAREIIIGLGGIVAGNVDRTTDALLWGPGAGSKKARGEQLGVQQYTERQFIELIRSHGVDMPLPKEAEWIQNTGALPVERDTRVDVKFEDGGSFAGKMAGEWRWKRHVDRRFNITHWRLAK